MASSPSATTFDLEKFFLEEEEYWDEVEHTILVHMKAPKTPICKQPMHTDQGRGHRWVNEVISGHVVRSYSCFRVHPTLFIRLRDVLVQRGVLEDTKNMSACEQLAIFLIEVGHGIGNRMLREWFQHSGETISRHFNAVLKAILSLRNDYMKLPNNDVGVHEKIHSDPKFYPFFKNALGAIDGTHIPVKVARDEQGPWRCHKGWTSQNVMACVNFDLLFLYVAVGWEGSASDMKVLTWSIDNGSFGVPEGKFYLVDGGYANTHQFLAPYRGYRYHLSTYEIGRSRVSYRDRKDIFNHRHAQLRNVVERAFGVLKARFAILTKQRNYPIETQVKIAMACFLLHNFIKREQGNDYIFRRVMVNPVSEVDHDDGDGIILRGTDTVRGESLRSGIAARLWARHNRARRAGGGN